HRRRSRLEPPDRRLMVEKVSDFVRERHARMRSLRAHLDFRRRTAVLVPVRAERPCPAILRNRNPRDIDVESVDAVDRLDRRVDIVLELALGRRLERSGYAAIAARFANAIDARRWLG